MAHDDSNEQTFFRKAIRGAETRAEKKEEIEEIENEAALDEISFQSQCVLIENYEKFVKNNWDTYYDYFSIIHGPPPTLINNLFSIEDIEPFWSVKPEELSRLQPMVRIFKVYYDPDGNEKYSVEMPFDTKLDTRDLSTITSTRVSRGSGVGLMSFDWQLQGSNPATATKIIESTLKLRFESLQDIGTPRQTRRSTGEGDTVKFTDFLILPKKRLDSEDSDRTVYNPNYFSFRVVVGWADPQFLRSDFSSLRSKRWQDLARVIRKDKNLFILTMTDHEVEVTQEGPVYLTINANARIDASAYTEDSDIFHLYKQNIGYEVVRDMVSEQAQKIEKLSRCDFEGNEQAQERVEELKERLNQTQGSFNAIKSAMWSVLLEDIINDNRIFNVRVPASELEVSREYGFFGAGRIADSVSEYLNDTFGDLEVFDVPIADPDRFNAETTVSRSGKDRKRVNADNLQITRYQGRDRLREVRASTNLEELEEEALEARENQVAGNLVEKGGELFIDIPFIYFGDILEVAMKAFHGEDNKQTSTSTMKTLIGDIVLVDPDKNSRVSINMADIPISMTLFQDWYIKNVYGKQRDKWPVKTFIRQALEELVVTALNPQGCFLGVPQRKIKLSITGFTLPVVEENTDPILGTSNCTGRVTIDQLRDVRKEYKNVESDNYIQYQVLYASEVEPASMVADPDRDAKRGVPWFWLGRDRGLIKEINFKRNDMPFLREARIVEDGESQFAKLREHYSADISMFGNNLFVPGQLIYINPSTIALGSEEDGESIAEILGLIGYYRVMNVSSIIQPGKFETKIEAIWEASGTGRTQSEASKRKKQKQEEEKSQEEKDVCLEISRGLEESEIEPMENANNLAITMLAPDESNSAICGTKLTPEAERARESLKNTTIGPFQTVPDYMKNPNTA